MTITFKSELSSNFVEMSENKGKNIEASNDALTLTTSLVGAVVVSKFPQHVRCWPHPGITTNLRTRKEAEELSGKGNRIMDRITYEEACDYVEKNWIPLSSLNLALFSSMLQKIHQRIIAPEHPNLKGVPPGQYRPAIEGMEMFIFKNESVCKFQTVPAYIMHKIESLSRDSEGEVKAEELRAIIIEVAMATLMRYSCYDMVTKKVISPKALELINEIFVVFPPGKDVPSLMEKMFVQILKKLQTYEESFIEKICERKALSIDEWIISKNKDLFGLQLSKMSQQDLQKDFPEDAISIAAFAHLEFVRIHPFTDANGRMARMLMNIILMQGGHQPIGFAYDKPYVNAIRAEDAGCVGAFDRFLRKTIQETSLVPIYEWQKKKIAKLLIRL